MSDVSHFKEVLVVHANARLTVHVRRLIVRRRSAGWAQAYIAAAMGCSRKTVRYWIARFEAEGDAGLADRSTRPLTSPTRVPIEVEAEAVRLRNTERLSRHELADRVGVSPRTASRIIARNGLPPLAALDPMTGAVIRASRRTAVRYQRQHPGEPVHMDVKKLGRIPDGGGWRAGDGTTMNHASRRDKTPIGYDFVHSLVDDCTRLVYRGPAGRQGPTCAGFLARALDDFFAAHGFDHVERLMTDTPGPTGSRFVSSAPQGASTRSSSDPTAPGRTARSNASTGTLQTEWAYRRPFTTNADRTAALDLWLEHYNTQRRHSAIGDRPPLSLLEPKS